MSGTPSGAFGIAPDVVVTGGVARNVGVVQALREALDLAVQTPEHPEIAGALGAALLSHCHMARWELGDVTTMTPEEEQAPLA